MAKENKSSGQWGQGGSIRSLFNGKAQDYDPVAAHEAGMNDLHEGNINVDIASGGTAFLGRADTFQYEREKEIKSEKRKEKEKKDKDIERDILSRYLDNIQDILDRLAKEIADLIKCIREREERLNKNIAEFDENELKLDAIDKFMAADKPARKPDGSFENDIINQIIIISGYNPADLSDAEARKLLDEAAADLKEKQNELSNSIKDDTEGLEKDTKALEEAREKKSKYKRIRDEVSAKQREENLTNDQGPELLEDIRKREDLDDIDLDNIKRGLREENNQAAADLLTETLSEETDLDRSESKEFQDNTLSIFSLKP